MLLQRALRRADVQIEERGLQSGRQSLEAVVQMALKPRAEIKHRPCQGVRPASGQLVLTHKLRLYGRHVSFNSSSYLYGRKQNKTKPRICSPDDHLERNWTAAGSVAHSSGGVSVAPILSYLCRFTSLAEFS